MLEFENENREFLAEEFGHQLECARELLSIGQRVAKSLQLRFREGEDKFDPRAAMVVLLVFAKLLRHCRASILIWEYGYSKESEVVVRSLFELHLAARFIIEPRVPQPSWSTHLRAEFDHLCGLSGDGISRLTDINFRAMLYGACGPIKLDDKTEDFKEMPVLRGILPSDFGKGMRIAATEAEDLIGKEWADRIRKNGKFHGFTQIKLLAEYCGADSAHYYQTIYGMQSGTSHGEGALTLKRKQSRKSLMNDLCLPCGILGTSIDDFNRVFSLGHAAELLRLAERIESVFGTAGERL